MWPDDEGQRTRISCGQGVDGCVWVAFAGRWRCTFMVRWGGGMDGVRVAGLASFLDVSVDKTVFLCCFDFCM